MRLQYTAVACMFGRKQCADADYAILRTVDLGMPTKS